jgi:hypothetical protein
MDLGLLIIDILFSDNKYAHDLTGSRAYNDATVLDILPKNAVFPLISRQRLRYNHHQNILGSNQNIISYFQSSLEGILTKRHREITTREGAIKYYSVKKKPFKPGDMDGK